LVSELVTFAPDRQSHCGVILIMSSRFYCLYFVLYSTSGPPPCRKYISKMNRRPLERLRLRPWSEVLCNTGGSNRPDWSCNIRALQCI